MSLRVLRAGLLTTVQDLGRTGFQNQGVVVSGAVDAFALRVANLLVGNSEGAAGVEITVRGPRLEFLKDRLIAVCGADLSPTLNGTAVKLWRPVSVSRGSILEFGAPRLGCRAYLALAGGLDVPVILGSRSTYLRGGLGRAMKDGDVVGTGRASAWASRMLQKLSSSDAKTASWYLSPALLPPYSPSPVLRVIPGNQFETFSQACRERFFQSAYSVTPQSDRMGCRLAGTPLEVETTQEMISEAVTFGTVQVPPQGQPILLLADRQTTGGYPKIAQVAAVDLPLAAQLKPGDSVRFQEITLSEAHALFLAREAALTSLRFALAHFH
ncbi:biotin-dependent carboxyltransferase family protein [Tumebacillus sp. ITR2]|uniref:Biotin-dependent carboxyltransferase family protein n=1 Tax=Tumebacillus amylolyticus TaxID=2801339 RepID=A0ABS1JAP9_9BACL|nr:biotin-dependent carboxyltransferase family protein [Tumebacillus amylolyticus]MBL0387109.1 biotin-dependent carboxyltransferase family protein [Tumebacillus amylolyticus]